MATEESRIMSWRLIYAPGMVSGGQTITRDYLHKITIFLKSRGVFITHIILN